MAQTTIVESNFVNKRMLLALSSHFPFPRLETANLLWAIAVTSVESAND
jgi:hypothetical protein